MRGQRFWSTTVWLMLVMLFTACRPATPTPTSSASPDPPTASPEKPTPTPARPTPTAALPTPTPTPTPLPTWPDRWEPTGGPYGGVIAALVADPTTPDTLYAAGAGGTVYKSSDGGEVWRPGERLAPPSCPFSSLVIDAAGFIYTANACTGVFKSSDAGVTWSHAASGIDDSITLLVQAPHAPDLLLAASQEGQIYRSGDGAVTWEPISDGLPGEQVRSLTASGPDAYWATTTSGSLYRFQAGSWALVSWGQPPDVGAANVLVDANDPNTILVGLANAAPGSDDAFLCRSSDGGFNWTPLRYEGHGPAADTYLLGQGQSSGVLYAASDDELLSSPDGGATWKRIELPRDTLGAGNLRQIAIDPADNDVLYLPLHGSGIVKSDDGGRTWRTVNEDLNNVSVSFIASHPSDPATLYAVATDGAGVFKSSDYGDSWSRLNGDGSDQSLVRRTGALVVDPKHPTTLYRTADSARILRSDDGGRSWSLAWPDLRFSSIHALAATPSTPTMLYANQAGVGLFRSDDEGGSWRFLSQAEVDYTPALAVHPYNADFILSGYSRKSFETSAQVHRSQDGGASWEVVLEVPDATGVTSVAFDPRVEPFFRRGQQPADPTRLYAASSGPRGRLWFSNDAGDSWKPLNDDLNFTNVHVLAVAPHRPGVAYAAVWGGGTWRTDDGGQNWRRLPGDPAISAAAIAVDPSNHNVSYIADRTTPHLYRSTDDGNTWELFFDAGADYERLAALALASSDPTILYVSACKSADGPGAGTVFRIDTNLPVGENATDITSNLPGVPVSLAVHRRDPRRIFAALHAGGVWKTVDDGASWRQVKSGLPESGFIQIVTDPIQPETLFLTGSDARFASAGLEHGIWKSTDDGNTWHKLGGATFGRASGPVKAIAFHPDDQQVMYAAGEGGIYLSPDRGATWTSINSRIPFIPMNAVATDGQTLYAGSGGGGLFAGPIHPLIHTADWRRESQLAVPVAHVQITLHPDDPQLLYASAFPGGVFETTDGGATWHERNAGLPSFAVADPLRQGYYALAIAPTLPSRLYLGTWAHGIYRSDDGAATWQPVYEAGRTVNALLVHPADPDRVYVASDEGVWRTADGGHSWEEFSRGLPSGSGVRTLALGANGQLYAGTRGYGLYTRSALGQAQDEAWRQLPELGNGDASSPPTGDASSPPTGDASSPPTLLLLQPHDSNTIYASSFPAGIYKTTDGGAVWREHNVGLKNANVLSLVFRTDDTQIIYAGTTDGMARSVDGGATWHAWDSGWPPAQRIPSIVCDPTNPDVMYACSQSSRTEQGTAGFHGSVMKSVDGGATWFEITTGLSPDQTFHQVLIDRFDPRIVYLATEREGVYISRDGGETWASWNEGLWSRVAGSGGSNAAGVLQFSADGRLLYFGTAGSGVWRRPALGAPGE